MVKRDIPRDVPQAVELSESGSFDEMEEKLGRLDGTARGAVLRELWAVWKDGVFPNGVKVRSDATRMKAQGELLKALTEEESEGELGIRLVLDAHVLCAQCGGRLLADGRVGEERVSGMLGEVSDESS